MLKEGKVMTLEERNEDRWNMYTILLLLVGLEHIMLVLKTSMATAIADVPKKVLEAEYKREKIQNEAVAQVTKMKYKLNAETYEEMMTRMQKEKQKQEDEERMRATRAKFSSGESGAN